MGEVHWRRRGFSALGHLLLQVTRVMREHWGQVL